MDLGGIDRMAGESGFNTSWDDPKGPATYGNDGNMTYDQWMQSLGYEKGSYGHADDGYQRFVEGGGGWIRNPKTDLGKTEVALGQQGAIAEVENNKINKTVDQAESKQESNDNEITNNYETPADYGWITGGVVKEDKDKSDYPNNMTQEEFNAMYEFALGMTGQSPDRLLDDNGKPIGVWGGFDELPRQIEQLDKKIGRGLSPTRLAEAEKAKADIQEQYDVLSGFVNNYKDLYKPIEQEKEDNQAELAAIQAKENYDKAFSERNASWRNLTKALGKAGMDINLRAEEILENESPTPDFENSAKDIVKAIRASDYKDTQFTIDAGDGNYTVETKKAPAAGVSAYNLSITSPRGDVVASGMITVPNRIANGSWDIKDKDGNTISKGESTSSFTNAVTNAITNTVGADYKVNKPEVPEDVRNAAQAVVDAESNYKATEQALRKADAERMSAVHEDTTQSKKDILNAYSSGKINAYQAAVALSKIGDSILDFGLDTIKSDSIKNDFGGPGLRSDKTVGEDSLARDMEKYPEKTTIDFKNLTEFSQVQEVVDSVDVSKIVDEKQAVETADILSKATARYAEIANTKLEDLVTKIAGEGKTLQEQREALKNLTNSEDFVKITQDIYKSAQSAYDKVSELEAHTQDYDLNKYNSKREVKKAQVEISQRIAKIQDAFFKDFSGVGNPETKAMGSYYSPGSNMGGTQSTGISDMTKEDIKAFANYANSLECTKDALTALMKSAAFNGAEDVKGGEYSEAWKDEPAIKTDKSLKGGLKARDATTLTWKDWVSASAKGLAGTVATIAGAGAMAVNPLVGGAILAAGLGITGKAGLDMTTKITGAHSTNREKMFAQQGTGVEKPSEENEFHIGAEGNKVTAKDVINDIGNRTTEQANIGDEKSVGTYTKTAGGFAEAVTGFVLLSSGNILGVLPIIDGVREMKHGLSGGLENNLDTAIQNVYQLATGVNTWAHANLDIDSLMNDPNAASNLMSSATPKDQVIGNRRTSDTALSSFGTASVNADADNKYSGYREEAKNKNLATDYNAGMEENTNEAVSSKYVKIFKVMLDKEPDYIRKVLIAIPKNHSEREW